MDSAGALIRVDIGFQKTLEEMGSIGALIPLDIDSSPTRLQMRLIILEDMLIIPS